MNNSRAIIILGFIGGFMMPPVAWLASLVYLGIVNFDGLLQIALTPLLWVYVIGYNLLVYVLVNRRLTRLARHLEAPAAAGIREAQNDVAFLPRFYIVAEILYCLIGPNTGMFGHAFLTGTEYLLGELVAIPIILLFALPFYGYTMTVLERWTTRIPLADQYGLLSLNFKLALNILVTALGILALFIMVNVTLVNVHSGELTLIREAILEKNLVVALISLVIVLVDYFIVRGIIQPIPLITRQIRQLAERELPALITGIQRMAQGDLTATITFTGQATQVDARDELGTMAYSHNEMNLVLETMAANLGQMSANLRQVIGQAMDSAASVREASGQLATAAAQASQATAQISATIQQIALGTAQQTTSITQTAHLAESISHTSHGASQGGREQAQATRTTSAIAAQIAAAVQQVADNAQMGARESAAAAQAAQDGMKTVQETVAGMETIKLKVGLSGVQVKEMGQHSDQIGSIVETIDDIAAQTNLLALNAAIEAARAGEHGAGFAVVADEVRKLAERSSAATKEIGGLIRSIQQTVAHAVTAMDESAQEVEKGVVRSQRAGEVLVNILQAVETIDQQVGKIAASAQKMSRSANELVTAMKAASATAEANTVATETVMASSAQISQAIENIASASEENAAAVEEVSTSAQVMNEQGGQVAALAESLNAMAHTLQQAVAQFRIKSESPKPARKSSTR